MRKLIGILIVGALLCFGQMASAGPYEDGLAAYQRRDYVTALKLWRPLAEQRNAAAQFNLGLMYEHGRGVPQDDMEAVKWYRLSAEQGYAGSQNSLGLMYLNGRGVAQDYKEAVRWFRMAVEQGHAGAQTSLGFMYDKGLGVPQDDKEAVKWFRLSAEQGYAKAQYNLGVMYDEGHGVPQDFKEAARWWRLSAEQGDADAQVNLGLMYEEGQGVPQDYMRAHMWLNLAAASQSGERAKTATNDRNRIVAKMTPAQIERAQEMARKCKTSNNKQCGEPESTPQTAGRTPSPPQTASTDSSPSISSSATSVPMTQQGGTFVVPVLINNKIELNFVVDSGAADVTIPSDVVAVMMRTGTLTEKDFGPKQTYVLADGSRQESRTFRIRSLKVGDRVVENVMGSEAHAEGLLLLGQSFLRKFKSWSIDNTKHALVLE